MPTVRAHDRTGRRAGLSGALRGVGLDAKPGRAGRMVPAMERRVSGQMERRMQILGKASTATGILVMLIPAAVHIVWPPSAVCLEVCGLALVYLGRWLRWI